MKSRTLLIVADVAEAITPIVGCQIDAADIFPLIGTGEIQPLGYVVRAPVFHPAQIAEVAATIRRALASNADTTTSRRRNDVI